MRGTPGGASREEVGASGAAASSSGEGAEAMCRGVSAEDRSPAVRAGGGREGVAGAWNGAGAGKSGVSWGRANSLAWAGGVG